MKRFALVAMLLCGSAYAQPPVEVVADDTIELQLGQTKTFRLDVPVSSIDVASKDVAEVRPQSDRTFSVRAVGYGSALIVAHVGDGTELRRINVAVAGSMVKIYGPSRRGAATGAEYNGYICTDTSCGRLNPDVEPAPSGVAISETKQDKDGNSRTVTKEYR